MGAAHSFTRRHIISSSLAARRARYSGSLLLPKVNNKNVRTPTLDEHSVFRAQESTVTSISFSLTRPRREKSSASSRGTRKLPAPVGAGVDGGQLPEPGILVFYTREHSKGPGKGWSPQPHDSLREVSCTCMGDLATGRNLEGRNTKFNKGTCKKETCRWIPSFLYWADAASFLSAYSLPPS